jgi:hypothetical protein
MLHQAPVELQRLSLKGFSIMHARNTDLICTTFTRNIFETVKFKEIKMSFAWDAAPCSVVEIY